MTLSELKKISNIDDYLYDEDLKKGLNYSKDNVKYLNNLTTYRSREEYTEYYFRVITNNIINNVEIDSDDDGNLTYVYCNCNNFYIYDSCPHIAAAFINYENIICPNKETRLENIYDNILNKYYIEPNNKIKKEVNIEITLNILEPNRYFYSSNPYTQVELSLGIDKKYKLNNKLSGFTEIFDNKQGTFYFGKNFTYDPSIHYFTKENEQIINSFIEYQKNHYGTEIKELKKFLKSISNTAFIINNYRNDGIKEGFPIKSALNKINDTYHINFDLSNITRFFNNDYEYIIYQGQVYHLNYKEQQLIQDLLNRHLDEIVVKKDNFEKFTKGVFLILKKNMEIDASVNDIIIPNNISTEFYFDIRNNKIKATVKFKYDEEVVEYFDNNSLVLRDMNIENEAINDLLKYGFSLDKKQIELNDIDKQVYFIETGLEELASKYIIYTTEKFKNTSIRKKTNISSTFGIGKDNILSYDFNLGDINSDELVNIFKEIKNKKKYYRLKNGNILNLEDEALKQLESLSEDLELTDEEIIKGHGSILKYRAIYLDSLKSNKYNIIKTDNLFDNFIDKFYKYKDSNLTLDKKSLNKLRDYQIIGVKWLYNLDKTGFGGILADEMGLGKTIQVIFYIKQILLEEKDAKFLIVVPTSLAYNWDREFTLHSDDIKRVVCSGTKNKRMEILNNTENVNVIITTYGLLREDEELYLTKQFHSVIIDEAQNIKNNLAGITKTVKKIMADTKFALTGTPLENSVLELWSIFDFIMPGYLANLTKFQSKYRIKDFNETTDILIKGLNRQIKPFILRRKKEDVTKELPEKLINNIFIDLDSEQKKLYVAELERVKEEMDKAMMDGGMSKVRFIILTLLTKLRQICIDPSIIYENYTGNSNKMLTLNSIVNEYIQNNHKILIFSSFRSALNIVKQNLTKINIKSYMIDGSVNSQKRMDMVNDFNKNDEVKVFLIMLKSGGTGLNLTSADVVIHLDLWWNPQAENQATDRAHRIGQTKNVEVIHLITKGTIEEKILDLQSKKQMLSDKIIDGDIRDKNIISELTKEDIKNLLSYENEDN